MAVVLALLFVHLFRSALCQEEPGKVIFSFVCSYLSLFQELDTLAYICILAELSYDLWTLYIYEYNFIACGIPAGSSQYFCCCEDH